MKSIIDDISQVFSTYPSFFAVAILIAVFALTEVCKLPIKHFTAKIQDEITRKRVNAVIMLLPFAWGIAACEFMTIFGFKFSIVVGLAIGAIDFFVFEVLSRLLPDVKLGLISKKKIDTAITESVETTIQQKEIAQDVVEQVKTANDSLAEQVAKVVNK